MKKSSGQSGVIMIMFSANATTRNQCDNVFVVKKLMLEISNTVFVNQNKGGKIGF